MNHQTGGKHKSISNWFNIIYESFENQIHKTTNRRDLRNAGA